MMAWVTASQMATEKQLDYQFERMIRQALRTMPDGTITIVKQHNHIVQINIDEDRRHLGAENKRQHLHSVSSQ